MTDKAERTAAPTIAYERKEMQTIEQMRGTNIRELTDTKRLSEFV
jgi:hypothetical protein